MNKKGLKVLGVSAFLAGSLLGSAFPVYAENINVSVDGELLNMDQPPIIDENSRTLVPVRFVSEALGAKDIQWDANAQKATIFDENHKIEVTMDQPEIQVNGQTVGMDTTAKVVNGRIMIPARYIAEELGATVGWDEGSSTVTIQRAKPQTNNLVKYGLHVKQNFPISADSEGLKITLNSLYVYPIDSPAAKGIIEKYKLATSPTSTPKYLFWTDVNIENNSTDVIRYEWSDLRSKANIFIAGSSSSYAPAKSKLLEYKTRNNPEYLETWLLNPGEKVSGHSVYIGYDELNSIFLSNENGKGSEVTVADNK
jgi:hypothetical protein